MVLYIYKVEVWPGAGAGIQFSTKLASISTYIYIESIGCQHNI
jgi:hypothetical protein